MESSYWSDAVQSIPHHLALAQSTRVLLLVRMIKSVPEPFASAAKILVHEMAQRGIENWR